MTLSKRAITLAATGIPTLTPSQTPDIHLKVNPLPNPQLLELVRIINGNFEGLLFEVVGLEELFVDGVQFLFKGVGGFYFGGERQF
jgi:hypothetical protein